MKQPTIICMAPPPGPNAQIDAQIAALEIKADTPRIRRELASADSAKVAAAKAFVDDIDAKIIALRGQRV